MKVKELIHLLTADHVDMDAEVFFGDLDGKLVRTDIVNNVKIYKSSCGNFVYLNNKTDK